MRKLAIDTVRSARAAAFLAVYKWTKNDTYIAHSLEQWRTAQDPQTRDANFSLQIAMGTVQRWRSLNYLVQQLATKPQKLGLQERALLLTALYQAHFMDRVPEYSVVNESVELAKQYIRPSFAKMVNAVLRKYYRLPPTLPKDWGIYYSYPDIFVQRLKQEYSQEEAETILQQGNQAAKLFVRIRNGSNSSNEFELVHNETLQAAVANSTQVQRLKEDPSYYCMGLTQIRLLDVLARQTSTPKSILDLCAAPGGKLLTAHDLYPKAALVANEPSMQRQKILQSNLDKYDLKAKITNFLGEEYPQDTLFDLIILDAPCSNSGVLNKRAEARWRLTPEALAEHTSLQKALLSRSAQLLTPQGQIWYLTCSILPEENQQVVHNSGLTCVLQKTVLPAENNADGGFCALLSGDKSN